MTVNEFAMEILETDDEAYADGALWSMTGFPCFFHTDNPVREMAYALRHGIRATHRGFSWDEIYCGFDTYDARRVIRSKVALGWI